MVFSSDMKIYLFFHQNIKNILNSFLKLIINRGNLFSKFKLNKRHSDVDKSLKKNDSIYTVACIKHGAHFITEKVFLF